MRLGVILPNETADADPREIAGLAEYAETLGFEAVWLPDHLLPPAPFGDVYGGVHEALILLAHVAALTERVTWARPCSCCRCASRCCWPSSSPRSSGLPRAA